MRKSQKVPKYAVQPKNKLNGKSSKLRISKILKSGSFYECCRKTRKIALNLNKTF